jgi:osmotically-inducible protein OsmY
LVRIEQEQEHRGVTGIALSAALGLGIGVLGGIIGRELLTGFNTEPVKSAVRRLRPEADIEDEQDPLAVQQSVEQALADDPGAQALRVRVEALGDGIVELTGTVPDALSRQLAGDVARGVSGADVVVNRVLVEGSNGVSADLDSESS